MTTTESKKPERLTDKNEIAKLARAFMKNWDCGVLSTQFEKNENQFPYGSITPYVLTEEGDVIILISDLAVHTKNIWKNDRVGFTVFDMESANKQAAARVSLTGFAKIVDEKENPEQYARVSERYITFFPMARNYFKAHAFFFYVIRPDQVHYIRTFGQIYDFEAEGHWNLPTPKWIGNEKGAIEHMNKDHKEALMKYSREHLKIESGDVSLLSVDGEGFHMVVDGKIHYLNFLNDASDENGLHREFVKMAKS